MKTLNFFTTIANLLFVLLISASSLNAQNLLNNGSFNAGTGHWNSSGMSVEINSENVYGGSSSSNPTAEIDAQVGLRQRVNNILKGYYYQFSFKGSRRTNGSTPASVGIRLRIVGTNTNTVYYQFTKSYTNTSFSFTTETLVFFLPANMTDNHIFVEFTAHNNSSTHGVIVDDVQMVLLGSLPVKWESFTASTNPNDKRVVLNWVTSFENNNKYFVVERSGTNNQFDSIGSVNSNNSGEYRFVDNLSIAGNKLYRIRQVDLDGKFQYSKVLIVQSKEAKQANKLFPTMAQSSITIQVSMEQKAELIYSITDINGRIFKQIKHAVNDGLNQQLIDIAGLPIGTYYVVATSSGGSIIPAMRFHKVE